MPRISDDASTGPSRPRWHRRDGKTGDLVSPPHPGDRPASLGIDDILPSSGWMSVKPPGIRRN